jgi:hydrogenase nickel incorporation protein HypA/HybF
MHEVSIISSIIETVTLQCERDGYTKINSIRLRIGKASHISPDSLQFAFEAIKKNTLAETASLDIETVPIAARCDICHHEFTTHVTFIYNCPSCSSPSFTIINGQEMEIVDMEVD